MGATQVDDADRDKPARFAEFGKDRRKLFGQRPFYRTKERRNASPQYLGVLVASEPSYRGQRWVEIADEPNNPNQERGYGKEGGPDLPRASEVHDQRKDRKRDAEEVQREDGSAMREASVQETMMDVATIGAKERSSRDEAANDGEEQVGDG
jgi:hypothetical protein